MANWSLPTLTSNYASVLTELDNRFKDLAYGLDPGVISSLGGAAGTAVTPQTNFIRWSASNKKWEKYNGVAWADLEAEYDIKAKTASTAIATQTTATTAAAEHYLTFVDSNNSTATSETLYSNTALKYTPSTGTLATTTFSGSLDGNANTSTSSSKVQTTATTAAAEHYLTFVDSNNTTATPETLYSNTALKYTPSTGTLTAATFSGNLTGNATSASTATTAGVATFVPTTSTSTNASFNIVFAEHNSAGATMRLATGSGAEANQLYFNPYTGTISTIKVNALVEYKINGTTVIDSNRALVNIANWANITVGNATNATNATSAESLNTNNNYQVNSLGVGAAASGVAGDLRAGGDITAYYSSDSRLKTNIQPIPNALEKVRKLSGNTFDWTDEYVAKHGGEDEYFLRKKDIGLIAQELESVLPELVVTRDDGYKAVKYDKVVALLIEAIKELDLKISGGHNERG